MNTHYRHYSKHSRHAWAPGKHRVYRGGYRRYSRRHAHHTYYLRPTVRRAPAMKHPLHVVGQREHGRTTVLSVLMQELAQKQAVIARRPSEMPYIVIHDRPGTWAKQSLEALFEALNEDFISDAASTLSEQERAAGDAE